MIVYTATDGRKLAPNRAWPGVWMICLSNSRPPAPWKWMPLGYSSKDPVRNAKRPRILPWHYLPAWDRCLWIDATMELIRDPRSMVGDFALCRHHERNCIYTEAEECIRQEKDDPGLIRQQMERYKGNHPEGYGLWATGLMLRTNTVRNKRVCDDWWMEISTGSRRDQLSFPVVARRHQLVIDDLKGRYDRNPWTRYHRKLSRVPA